MTSERELEALASLHVGHTPELNQDKSPGLGEWCSQLWSGENVVARVYGSTPDEAHSLATEFARRLASAQQAGTSVDGGRSVFQMIEEQEAAKAKRTGSRGEGGDA